MVTRMATVASSGASSSQLGTYCIYQRQYAAVAQNTEMHGTSLVGLRRLYLSLIIAVSVLALSEPSKHNRVTILSFSHRLLA